MLEHVYIYYAAYTIITLYLLITSIEHHCILNTDVLLVRWVGFKGPVKIRLCFEWVQNLSFLGIGS